MLPCASPVKLRNGWRVRFLGPARPAGFVAARLRHDGLRLGLAFALHGRLGAMQLVLNARPHPAQQPVAAQHVQVNIHQRRNFRLTILRQRRQPVFQLLQLVARALQRVLQPQ